MNERIQKFAEQAITSRNQYDPHTMLTKRVEEFDKEKFAELIIKECVHTVRNRGGMCGALASNWIEEHFGVE
jgi:hypothetical protein